MAKSPETKEWSPDSAEPPKSRVGTIHLFAGLSLGIALEMLLYGHPVNAGIQLLFGVVTLLVGREVARQSERTRDVCNRRLQGYVFTLVNVTPNGVRFDLHFRSPHDEYTLTVNRGQIFCAPAAVSGVQFPSAMWAPDSRLDFGHVVLMAELQYEILKPNN